MQSAVTLDYKNFRDIEKKLKTIQKAINPPHIGPVESAEVLRIFTFSKMPIDSMTIGLQSVNLLTAITRIDHKSLEGV